MFGEPLAISMAPPSSARILTRNLLPSSWIEKFKGAMFGGRTVSV